MQPLTLVTVTYNSSEVLARLLASVQSPDIEILVVDNGSQDGSQAIAAVAVVASLVILILQKPPG